MLRDGMRRRGKLDALAPFIDAAAAADADRRATIQAVEERKAARNSITQEVAKKKRAGENADSLLDQSRSLGEEISRLEAELAAGRGARAQHARAPERHPGRRA
jgi:Seryl-tRNA synthetase